MRVIAGTARRLLLKSPRGLSTRPTTDRIKETLFNMLCPYLQGCLFLDLFSGSGGIGIEALSRGAKKAVFVEKDREAISCIKYNITHTHFEDKAVLYETDVIAAIRKMHLKGECFDVIFMDPPYESDYIERVLQALYGTTLISKDTLIVAEAPIEKDFSFVLDYGYKIQKEKLYKTNKHVYIEFCGE